MKMNLCGLDRIDERLDEVQGGISCVADFDAETRAFILNDMARELREIADELELMTGGACGDHGRNCSTD